MNKPKQLALKLDPYFLMMMASIALALLWPSLGAKSGPLHLGSAVQIGVSLIFFLHGANLNLHEVWRGIANWRVHLFVQATTFVLFPIIGFLIFFVAAPFLTYEVRLGFFYLCAVCSTVSSSVAMVAMARGHVSTAIFDASLSGIIGMVITPALIALVYTIKSEAGTLGMVMEIMHTLLLPFVLGQLLRPIIKGWIARYKTWISRFDRFVILLIVYVSFCESTLSGLWSRTDANELLAVSAMAVALLLVMLTTTTFGSRALGFSKEDEIVAVFCGSKKSLANGAPVAAIVFGGSAGAGILLLPLIIYHQAQLIAGSILARRYAQRTELSDAPIPLPTGRDKKRLRRGAGPSACPIPISKKGT